LRRPFDRLSSDAPAEFVSDDHDAHLALIEDAIAHPANFEPLYRRYVSDIYYFCFRRLDHPEEAADATSRTFIKALASLPSFRPNRENAGATFRAWLFRIAYTTVTDMQRRQRPQTSIDQDDGATIPIQLRHPGHTPEEIVLANEAIHRVREMLRQLPERQRRVVELRLADLSGQEIADAMSMSVSAVKSAQFRAYQTLRILLRDDAPPSQGNPT
jgi:RNA polymerase sigma-70 factor (ECF subfamily)